MCVLVECAAEPVVSVEVEVEVEVVESVEVGDRIWLWAQWCGDVQGTVGSVPVRR